MIAATQASKDALLSSIIFDMKATEAAPRKRNAHERDDMDWTNSNSAFHSEEKLDKGGSSIVSSRTSIPTEISELAKIPSLRVRCESPTETTVSSYS